jgi:peptidoglycan/LPS O-acetylase OafA/YrhL
MNAHSLKSHAWRADIDGLRAVAIILVLIFHAFPFRFKGGFIGVDVFFVISGFLIGGVVKRELDQNNFSLLTFFYRRIRRIYPALLVVLIASIFAGYFLLPTDYKRLGWHVAASSVFMANFAFLNESGYFDNSPDSKPLMHLWSLAVEEQFYIIWPLAMMLFAKRVGFKIITAVMAAGSLAACLLMTPVDASAAYFLPWTRGWEMLAGVFISGVDLSLTRARRFQPALGWVGLLAIFAGFWLIDARNGFPGFLALVPVLGASAVILSGERIWGLDSKPLVWVGKISYPLYLWHWPLLCVPYFFGISGSIANKVGLLTSAFFLSWVTYRFVESPIRKQAANSRLVIILVAAMAIVGLTGFVLYKNEGLISRYPNGVQRLMRGVEPTDLTWRPHECFLHWNDKAGSYGPSCVEHGETPLVIIWGDSHAAALSGGIQSEAHSVGFRFGQLTGGGCPPFLKNIDHRVTSCNPSNEVAFHIINKSQPDAVILVADWYLYAAARHPGTAESYKLEGLQRTIKRLKMELKSTIVVVGPPPSWNIPMATLVLDYARRHNGEVIPEFTDDNLNPNVFQLEGEIKTLASEFGVKYVSLVDLLCKSRMCRTRLDESNLVTFDQDHLSPAASMFVAKQLAKELNIGR